MSKSNSKRIRASIPISGLDTSTPDLPIKDGAQETLHNMRHANGVWRDVKPLLMKHRLTASSDNIDLFSSLEIRYSHPASGEGVYIASTTNPDGTINLSQIAIQDNDTISVTDPDFAKNLPAGIQISHFGNILLLINSTKREIFHYYFNKKNYEKFDIPSPPVVKQSTVYNDIGEDYWGKLDDATYIKINKDETLSNVESIISSAFFNINNGLFYYKQIESHRNLNFFWGEICFFAAFQMSDGSIVSPSALNIASSEPRSCDQWGRTYIRRYSNRPDQLNQMAIPYFEAFFSDSEKADVCYIRRHNDNNPQVDGKLDVFNIMICPHITIQIPDKINDNLIKNVILYSTRINPIWDTEKLKTLKRGDRIYQNFTYYKANNKLPEQPFYFFQSIPIGEFINGEKSMHINAGRLKNIEQNDVYSPTEAHSIFYNMPMEYNSRIHICGELGLKLFPGYGNDFFTTKSDGTEYNIGTSVRIDSDEYFVITPTLSPFGDNSPIVRGNLIHNRILSYPDSRATFMYDIALDSNKSIGKIKLTSALENNYAYAICADDYEEYYNDINKQTCKADYVKYSIKFLTQIISDSTDITPNFHVHHPNKLRVSALNNPFSFPLENSYAIGSDNNRIRAVNSAAIEMSDAKFGEFPLYVFTDEGIFVLQSGNGEVLYSAVIPLNYDRIINPETLAINYNILYITSRGLHGMFSNQSTLLSEPINTPDNLPRLGFLTSARMCYQHKFGEIILYNTDLNTDGTPIHPIAYVFSLGSKTWSTRDFNGYKLNTDEVINRINTSSIEIFDINDEQSREKSPASVTLISRPLKLGNSEFKRLETLIPRWWSDSSQPAHVAIEGSSDLKEWVPLRVIRGDVVNGDITMRRTPFSVRYLRVRIDTAVSGNFEITGYDIEYYLRFLHRLR